MSEKARELYEEFLREYTEKGYLYSGCLHFDIDKKEEFKELEQMGLIQLRDCDAFAYELSSCFMVNGKFEELEALK